MMRYPALFCLAALSLSCFSINMPGRAHKTLPLDRGQATELLAQRLRVHVEELADNIGERNFRVDGSLAASLNYLETVFDSLGHSVSLQTYTWEEQEFHNLEVTLPGTAKPEEIILVGAHYDSIPGSPGADDNASGVAAVLELARLLSHEPLDRTVRFVCFVNEEPPFFSTSKMGSAVYARRAREREDAIVAMLSLESIGYFSSEKKSQRYPFPFSWFYPNKGNFIGFSSSRSSKRLVKQSIALFRENSEFPSRGLVAPEWFAPVNWSDNLSFNRQGYPAVMVTNTATFRNPHYHTNKDTPEKLDYVSMAHVVSGLENVIRRLASL